MTQKSIPKVELHTHLEGCAPPAFICGLVHEKSLDISGIFNTDGTYAYRDFDHFLRVYEAACTTLQILEDFYRLTKAVLEESASHGIVYQETFVSPDFCGGSNVFLNAQINGKGLSKWADYPIRKLRATGARSPCPRMTRPSLAPR